MISLIGIFFLFLKDKTLKKILLILVSFSAGSLFGGAFVHLIPEAFKELPAIFVSIVILLGIVIFFVIEKFIHWRHCHNIECEENYCYNPKCTKHPKSLAYMNLIGDSVHNFVDGLIIGASYLVSIPIGITTTIAVALHEIPQEIGDFGVMLKGGLTKKRALMFNFLSALTAVLGAIIILILGYRLQSLAIYLLPFAAGGFIYIAGSDLIPELHKEIKVSKTLVQLLALIVGIGLMYSLLLLE